MNADTAKLIRDALAEVTAAGQYVHSLWFDARCMAGEARAHEAELNDAFARLTKAQLSLTVALKDNNHEVA